MDLTVLFDLSEESTKYNSVKEELEAVASGHKAMSVFLFPRTSVGDNPLYSELERISSRLNLSVVIMDRNEAETDSGRRMVDVFLTRPTELWRATAYSAFKKAFDSYEWSDAAERFESTILGYSDEDITKWLHVHSRLRVGWSGRSFYLLLSSGEAASVRSYAKRYIDPKTISEPITAFFNRKHNLLKEDAEELLPKGVALARVAVCQSFFRELFRSKITPVEPDVMVSLLTPEKIAGMNSALKSNFQFLEAGVWK